MLSRIFYDLYMRILELNNSGVNYPRKYNTHLEIIARNKSYSHMSDFSNSFLDHLARTDVSFCHFATTRNKWSHYDFTTTTLSSVCVSSFRLHTRFNVFTNIIFTFFIFQNCYSESIVIGAK